MTDISEESCVVAVEGDRVHSVYVPPTEFQKAYAALLERKLPLRGCIFPNPQDFLMSDDRSPKNAPETVRAPETFPDNVVDLAARRAAEDVFKFECFHLDDWTFGVSDNGERVVMHRNGTLEGFSFAVEAAEILGRELIQTAMVARLEALGRLKDPDGEEDVVL